MGVVLTDAAYSPLPAAPPPPVVQPGSVFSSDVIDAATGFVAAQTSLTSQTSPTGLRIFPLWTAQPEKGWRSTATSSLWVVASWRRGKPLAAAAVRLGGRGRLGVLEVENAEALSAFTDRFGPLPADTVQSRSTRGCHRFWVRLPRDDIRTIHNIAPSVTLYASGAWMKLPPAGVWVLGVEPGRANFEPLPSGLLPAVAEVEPTPNIRRFK